MCVVLVVCVVLFIVFELVMLIIFDVCMCVVLILYKDGSVDKVVVINDVVK